MFAKDCKSLIFLQWSLHVIYLDSVSSHVYFLSDRQIFFFLILTVTIISTLFSTAEMSQQEVASEFKLFSSECLVSECMELKTKRTSHGQIARAMNWLQKLLVDSTARVMRWLIEL